MTAPERDEEFEAYLQRRSSLHRDLPEHESMEPPPELDRIVLSRARQAISSRPDLPVFRPSRWAFPAALAATIVLSFTIFVSVHQSTDTSVPVASSAKADAADIGSGAELARQEESRSDYAAAAAPEPELPAPAAPAAAAVAEEPDAMRERAADRALTDGPLVASRSSAPLATLEQRPVPKQGIASALNQGAVSALRKAAPLEDERRADPDVWMRWIEELRASGKSTEAEQELRALREAYPEYPVPQDAQRAN